LFYPGIAVAISATAYFGFYFTYFAPVAAGNYPSVSPIVHIHGWSFILWYLLFPLQALLASKGPRRLHIVLGQSSLALVAVMAFTGLLVASVRIDDSLTSTTDLASFWGTFGVTITSTLFLFVGFYIAAIINRSRPQLHKRLMIMASASALNAAVFRIVVGISGVNWLHAPGWVAPAAIFLPNLFIVAGMVYDRLTRRSIHSIYTLGLTIAIGTEGLALLLVASPFGDQVRRILATFSDVFGCLYQLFGVHNQRHVVLCGISFGVLRSRVNGHLEDVGVLTHASLPCSGGAYIAKISGPVSFLVSLAKQ